jgi:hypothetical protein
MKRDDLSDHETFVQIREGTWRFRNRRGTIAATVPVTCHEQFHELAVLAVPGFDKPRYAARAAGTQDWVHYYQLQPWMYQVVEEYLSMTERYARVAEIVKEASRVLG